MRSLWLKLVGAFALVILVSVAANSFLISRATNGQFSRYVTQNGQAWAARLAPALADYYARTGGWQGVEGALRARWPGMVGMGMAQAQPRQATGAGMGLGMGGMMGPGMGSQASGVERGADMWAMMGLRLLLADERGRVVVDSAASRPSAPTTGLMGTQLKPADLGAGTPVLVSGRQVATLLAVEATTNATTPAGDFVTAVNRSTWLVGMVAGLLALALGLLLFRQIVAPVRAVTAAAQTIAAGDLGQRVPVSSRDEIGQMALSFNYMADALARDQQLRRSMVADIAHELGTPLSILQSHLEAMLDGVLPASPSEIASLHDETSHLSRLVADLRLLSLAEAGQLTLECTRTDLGTLVQSVVDRHKLQASGAGVELVAEVSPALPAVNVDGGRIGQAISNLVDNALCYTPEAGRVTVRAYPQTADGHRSAVVEVVDTGCGIVPEDLPRVFDRFYRTDRSRSRSSGGSGIGLAIVKQLVEAHGGRVGVQSQPEQGTTFSLVLPPA